uniref:NADH dehydrogenase subunit 3 n=1 Tax=Xenostrobus securis TaxID=1289581 RepID=UPI00226D2900|nr:NADH dehydrogenase subunit 3 [Xenostrobus securis]UZG65992.1 NADH dehydrogenase subunit 3 [Xenostrobus securis]
MFLFLTVLFLMGLSVLLIGLCGLLFMKGQSNREKLSPYECGFDPIWSARSSFSLRFFLLAALFVVFDVEVVCLVPVLFNVAHEYSMVGVSSVLLFLLVLSAGCLFERREGSMDWVSEK